MKKLLPFLALMLLSTQVSAQDIESIEYDWDETPAFVVADTDTAETVGLKKHVIREFIVDETGLSEYVVEHSAMLLNSDNAIERYNKVTLPFDLSSEVHNTKARVISPEGEVKELDQSDILTAEDEETGDSYQYFAFEGIKTGSIVEYFYVLQTYPSYRGSRAFMQYYYPVKDVTFELYAPNYLVFDFKSYNGLNEVELDTLYEGAGNRWMVHEDYVPRIPDEELADQNAHRKALIYKLDRNEANGLKEISSYGSFSEDVYAFMFTDLTKADRKSIAKFVKKLGIDEGLSEKEKIRAVEDHLKENIHVIDVYDPQFNEVDFILENNFTTEKGFTRFFANCLKELDINLQIVLTTDRTTLPFDPEFEGATFLREYLFYFPSIKQYTAPAYLVSRLGYPPYEYTDNYGLFIKEVSLGDYQTGIGKIKYIDAIPYKDNFDKLIVDVTFSDEDPSEMDLKIDHTVGGYYAMNIQPILHLVDESDAEEITDGLIDFINEDFEVTNKEMTNGDVSSFGIKPLQVKAEVTTDAMVERAGNKFLFRIGELIGPQMEMYQEKERELPVSSAYGHHYDRTIRFTIPDGYTVEGLDKLVIDNQKSMGEDGEVDFYFVSSYEQEGNVVTVSVIEYYTEHEISPENYEKYRSVINCAADFNKIKLVLIKK